MTPTIVTHITVTVPSGTTLNPTPNNPDRNFLVIYNVGANIGYVRFGEPNKATPTAANGDIPVPSQGVLGPFVDQVPIAGIYLAAPNGDTSFTIVQGLPYRGSRK
jgi:hypothetical protein